MFTHVPVLLQECIEGLNIKSDGIYVDCTLGRGGHSSEILKRLSKGHLYCFDQDQQAIDESKDRLKLISGGSGGFSAYLLINKETCSWEKAAKTFLPPIKKRRKR